MFESLKSLSSNLLVPGANESSLAFMLWQAKNRLRRPVVAVVPEALSHLLAANLSTFSPAKVLPGWDVELDCGLPPSSDTVRMRLEVLYALLNEDRFTLVVTPKGWLQPLWDPDSFLDSLLVLVKGMEVDRAELIQRLANSGYRRVPLVEDPGGFSVRGSVIDVFPPGEELPFRIELWDNEVESIGRFNPSTQCSVDEVGRLRILPAKEPLEMLNTPLNRLLPQDSVVFLIEPEIVASEAKAFENQELPPWEIGEIEREFTVVKVNGVEEGTTLPFAPAPWPAANLSPYGEKRIEVVIQQVKSLMEDVYHCYCFVDGGIKACERVKEYLLDRGIAPKISEGFVGEKEPGFTLIPGRLTRGFLYQEGPWAFVSGEEIWGRRRVRTKAKKRHILRHKRDILTSLREIEPGDAVVHVDHGIGIYRELKRVEVEGDVGEFMAIEYQGGDMLYVPISKLNLVHRYASATEAPPRIDRLGGTTWRKACSKVKRDLEEFAKQLVRQEAERRVVKGHAFSPDVPWQEEFEAKFPFEETPDQETAWEEIRRKMESPKPMDHLLCGDVGYGKTEVVMRAAFKAVMDGKQVAVLVPTTLLAEQHLQTFRERFKGYPVVIEAISRFRSRKEQSEILSKVAEGKVDILIGTHRLLSGDLVFKDLGLLVIDEEHRFGVKQKEQLKALRKGVDIISLSATPIPRSLNMALSGLRSMSRIETPPRGRMPVKTFIARFSDRSLKRAIENELNRGGKVLVVQQRVEGLDELHHRITTLVPNARTGVAHGQMRERELERVVLSFFKGEIQVLVATAIVEAGLDIPLVNTLVVVGAERFGMAQLYQLRGRVGRGEREAYAHFLVTAKEITPAMQRRLRALQEFSKLGSGFQLAMRDLEIRGAGSILGKKQWGRVSEVGIEQFSRMLEKTIQRIKGQVVDESPEPEIRLGVEALIPPEYVGDDKVRLAIYKRIASESTHQGLREIEEEIRDRFGPLPEQLVALIKQGHIQVWAKELMMERIQRRGRRVLMVWYPHSPLAKVTNKRWKKVLDFRPFELKGNALQFYLGEGDDPVDLLSSCLPLLLDGANGVNQHTKREGSI